MNGGDAVLEALRPHDSNETPFIRFSHRTAQMGYICSRAFLPAITESYFGGVTGTRTPDPLLAKQVL